MKYLNLVIYSLVFIVGLSLTSCTMESSTHFNENNSGSQVVSMNVGEMMDLMSTFGQGQGGEMDDMMSKFNDPEFADSLSMMEDSLSGIFAGTGAKNFSIAFSDEGTMSLGYEFESLAAFDKMKKRSQELSDRAGNGMPSDGLSEMLSSMIGGNYSQSGKWLSIPISSGGMMDELGGELPGGMDMSSDEMEENMKMMEGFMGGSIMFKNVYTFDKQIKKVKANVPFKQEGNKMTIEYSLSDLLKWDKEDEKAEVKVKLK